jgi:hypothetical protein
MRHCLGNARTLAIVPLSLCLLFAALAGCGTQAGRSPVGGQTSADEQEMVIDWVDFVQFGEISYQAVSPWPGRALSAHDLGPVFATVHFQLNGHVHTANYRSKDGDAAYLAPGTHMYMFKGYTPAFRLAAYEHGCLTLYEADTNPHAHKGAVLLDIGGKGTFIGVNSEQDEVTELGAIKGKTQVSALINMVLQAPVDQSRSGQGQIGYFIAFHLLDGTVVLRAFWPQSGILQRGLLLPSAFADAMQGAVAK